MEKQSPYRRSLPIKLTAESFGSSALTSWKNKKDPINLELIEKANDDNVFQETNTNESKLSPNRNLNQHKNITPEENSSGQPVPVQLLHSAVRRRAGSSFTGKRSSVLLQTAEELDTNESDKLTPINSVVTYARPRPVAANFRRQSSPSTFYQPERVNSSLTSNPDKHVDYVTTRIEAEDIFNVNRPRRNSNPGVLAGSIYVTRPWRRRTSVTTGSDANIKGCSPTNGRQAYQYLHLN